MGAALTLAPLSTPAAWATTPPSCSPRRWATPSTAAWASSTCAPWSISTGKANVCHDRRPIHNPFQRFVQAFASSRPGASFGSHVMHHLDRFVFKLSRGSTTATSYLAGFPMVVLTTIGAKSGQLRTTPLVAIRDPGIRPHRSDRQQLGPGSSPRLVPQSQGQPPRHLRHRRCVRGVPGARSHRGRIHQHLASRQPDLPRLHAIQTTRW